MLHLHIIRYVESYDFKAEPDKPDSFSNNWKNNSLDDFILLNDDTELFKCKCQSVANYCFGDSCPEIRFLTETALPPEILPCAASYRRGNFTDKSTLLRRQGFRIINSVKKNSSLHGINDDKMFLGWNNDITRII